jgi:hypothetical protein
MDGWMDLFEIPGSTLKSPRIEIGEALVVEGVGIFRAEAARVIEILDGRSYSRSSVGIAAVVEGDSKALRGLLA